LTYVRKGSANQLDALMWLSVKSAVPHSSV